MSKHFRIFKIEGTDSEQFAKIIIAEVFSGIDC